MEIPTPFEALEEAARRAGPTQDDFAAVLGISQPAVWKILQVSKRLPVTHVLTVEKKLGVPKEYLRPDIYPINDMARMKPLADYPTPPRVPARQPVRRTRRAKAAA